VASRTSDRVRFLIDENLSPELAKMAKARGFASLHVTWAKLQRAKDAKIARYAIAHNMVLVTNDLHDFRRIYQRKQLHPGIVFLRHMDDDLMSLEAQRHMFEAALDQVAASEPVNEAIFVRLEDTEDGNWRRTTLRFPLPV
jgi:predicted nuclease of predicted toxin-antitoxin system